VIEEQRMVKEKRLMEEKRVIEEQKLIREQQRLVEEEQQRVIKEQQRILEEERLIEEKRLMEEQKLAEEMSIKEQQCSVEPSNSISEVLLEVPIDDHEVTVVDPRFEVHEEILECQSGLEVKEEKKCEVELETNDIEKSNESNTPKSINVSILPQSCTEYLARSPLEPKPDKKHKRDKERKKKKKKDSKKNDEDKNDRHKDHRDKPKKSKKSKKKKSKERERNKHGDGGNSPIQLTIEKEARGTEIRSTHKSGSLTPKEPFSIPKITLKLSDGCVKITGQQPDSSSGSKRRDSSSKEKRKSRSSSQKRAGPAAKIARVRGTNSLTGSPYSDFL